MKKYKHNFPKDRYVICAEYVFAYEKKVLSFIVDKSDIEIYYETRDGINAEYYPYLCYDPRNEIIVGYRVPETHFIQVSFEEFIAYIKGEGGKEINGDKVFSKYFHDNKSTLSEQIKTKEKELAVLKEKLAKENMPKDGEPCLVWDLDKEDKILRYSDGNGLFYMGEEESGDITTYNNFVRITIHPDDEHKLKD